MTDEISNDARLVLRRLTGDIRAALEDGIDVELVLDAVAAGLEGRDFGASPLGQSLARAMYSSVGPTMGGNGPTEELDTSAGPADAPPASQGPHAPGPAEASWNSTRRFQGAVTAFERTVL